MTVRTYWGMELDMGVLGRWYGDEDSLSNRAAVPMSDTDRIIEGQRKTRGLLVFIFLGVPLIVVVFVVLFFVLAS